METNMNYTLRKGLNVPVVTILDDAGRVIEADQRNVIRHVIQEGYGADVIFATGTTGEWNRLEHREHQRAMQIEIDEVLSINAALEALDSSRRKVEIWAGVNGHTKAEVLANLDAAIQLGADAAVIAPLAIRDLADQDIVHFFQRDVVALLEISRRELPVFLYDNADLAAPGNAPHIRTQIVKHLSRLPWVRGIKVSASRRVIGNYTKAALHYKQPGEFGIYIGNAMLIFEMYRPSHSLLGRVLEGWRDYLLHSTPPIGVISGPGNVMPREWQKSWRVCWAGDEESTEIYRSVCEEFELLCACEENGQRVVKMLASLKYALELDGLISSSLVGKGTPALNEAQKSLFREKYLGFKKSLATRLDRRWCTDRIQTARLPAAANSSQA
jgi:dihydrodipicolinate synthase/N-acetylneuraminate lyase